MNKFSPDGNMILRDLQNECWTKSGSLIEAMAEQILSIPLVASRTIRLHQSGVMHNVEETSIVTTDTLTIQNIKFVYDRCGLRITSILV